MSFIINLVVARAGELRKAYTILIRKTERKRSLGRLRHRWEDNINRDHNEVWT
jgi:hypothetical protein